MKSIYALCVAAGISLLSCTGALAQSFDLSSFLKSREGLAGLSAAAANLGNCTTELAWAQGFDIGSGEKKADAVAVSCSYYDPEMEEMLEKTVIAKFQFLEGIPYLIGMDHLP